VLGGLAAAVRLQAQLLRSDATAFMPLALTPLFTVIFLEIVREAGRHDLAPYAVLAPVLMALWQLSLLNSGEIVEDDRWQGTLELGVAAPVPYAVVVLGRVIAVTVIALTSFVEVWLVAWAVFGVTVDVHHPGAFALTLVATALATAGTATIMASLFIVTRSARTFQNSLSYPFFVLGGVLVPVAFLPNWLEPLASIVFLSWSADLLRATLQTQPVDGLAYRIAMVLLLGVAGFAIGFALLAHMLRRGRRDATLAVV
jgi:ABC-2 type transport system permease protein